MRIYWFILLFYLLPTMSLFAGGVGTSCYVYGSGQCDTGLFCSNQTGKCVACLSDRDCGGSGVSCKNYKCVCNGTYASYDSGLRRWSCGTCYAGCPTCEGPNPGSCTSCYSGMILKPADGSYNWNCKNCSDLFPIENGRCEECNEYNCHIASCNPGYHLKDESDLGINRPTFNHTCIKDKCVNNSDCTNGLVCEIETGLCVDVPSLPANCAAGNNGICTQCNAGYSLVSGACVKNKAKCQSPLNLSADGCCCSLYGG